MSNIFIKSSTIKYPHAFSTRHGGISKAPYNSLNLGFDIGDEYDGVISNWKLFSKSSGIPIEKLVCGFQIHKANVKIVDEQDAFNIDNIKKIKDCDGFVTNTSGITLSIFTADCAAVLLEDTNSKVIAAAHCGWKPFTAGILNNVLKKMMQLGANPKNINAAIGPCINECCFVVQKDVVDALTALLNKNAASCVKDLNDNKHYSVNLRKAIEKHLELLGIMKSNISHIDECTSCNNNKYFSYRADNKNTGRIAGIIHLPYN